MKIRLLRGVHACKGAPAGGYQAGSIFESDVDLSLKEPHRFECVHSSVDEKTVVRSEVAQHEVPDDDDVEDDEGDGLDEMSLKDLRSYAADNEIDLGKAKRKSTIVQLIRDGLEAVNEDADEIDESEED